MSDSFQKSEGIILRAVPCRENDHLLTLFTPSGVMKLMIYGSSSKRRGINGICTPLTKVEVVYRENGGEIFTCRDIALIDSFPQLRKELSPLESACDVIHSLLHSQWVGKPAPLLYSLLCFFLEKMPQASCPAAIALSFRLKLLKHDGLAVFPFCCTSCGEVLFDGAYTYYAEAWCQKHRPSGSFCWNKEDLEQMYLLSISQSYQAICAEKISAEFQTQVIHFFEEALER